MRVALLIATVVGFALTAGGLVSAYVSARKQVDAERERVMNMERLTEAEIAEARSDSAEATAKQSRGEFASPFDQNTWLKVQADARYAKYERLHKEAGTRRATTGNMVYLAAYEGHRVAGLALGAARASLIWAGVGLAVSTAASATALYL